MIPYGRQIVTAEDEAAVLNALRSPWLTQGPMVSGFEAAVAERCGAARAVATCNASAALHLACLALEVGPGDRVWTTPNTFVASANCARYCGAEVDFVDVDPITLNLSVPALAARLAVAAEAGTLPKVLIPVHFSGRACAMDEIATLAQRYGFRIIEDASHAVGAAFQDEPVGNCRHSDITVFSFHPVKIITTGEGGMALTNSPELARRMIRLRSHGISRDQADLEESHGPWYYEQSGLGFNYRLTDIQAALGLSQLERLDEVVARRRRLAERYHDLLAALPLRRPEPCPQSAWHLYCIRVEAERRRQVFEHLQADGIGVNVHYIPVHTQPDYRRLGFAWGDFPAAEHYYREAITLPLHPALSDEQQDRVVASLDRALQ